MLLLRHWYVTYWHYSKEYFMKDDTVLSQNAFWYILHTYASYEQRVEQTIREMIRTEQADGAIEDVLVPTEHVTNIVDGVKKRSTRKCYPGYVLVKMKMNDISWNMIRSIPKVISFVGSKDSPTPMKQSEVERLFNSLEDGVQKPKVKSLFSISDNVQVLEGPFAGFSGVVEEIFEDKCKLRITVAIFGRQTPVELDFAQVSKD